MARPVVSAGLRPFLLGVDNSILLAAAVPVGAVVVGLWIYLDARDRVSAELAPYVALVVGGLFLAGSLPAVVALVVAEDPVVQGFPTALRIIPGLVALGVYLAVR